jgi:hypothetical protein
MGRSEVDQHHGRCCRLFGDIRLWACSFDAASGAGLFAVGGVLSLFGLHLAEFTTKGISAAVFVVNFECYASKGLTLAPRSPHGKDCLDRG